MNIKMILATDKSGAIGIDNKIPWNMKSDITRFRKLTTDNVVIMGRKTFESLPGILKNRVNIVITSNTEYHELNNVLHDKYNINVIFKNSLEDALNLCNNLYNTKDIFIIGGSRLYNEAYNIVSTIYLTIVEVYIENADSFFLKSQRDIRQDFDEMYRLNLNNKQDNICLLDDYNSSYYVFKRKLI